MIKTTDFQDKGYLKKYLTTLFLTMRALVTIALITVIACNFRLLIRRTVSLCALLLLTVQLTSNTQAIAANLPMQGPAPPFTLTTQHNSTMSLEQLRGKVVVVSFMFTRCGDTCPLLAAKLVQIQNLLDNHFATEVHFLTVSLDSAFDKPDILDSYAAALGANSAGWTFLTGNPVEIIDTVRRYGVFHRKQSDGVIDHNLLTSIIDHDGMLRVQYMGDRFDPNEFLTDVQSLLKPVDNPLAPPESSL